MSRNMWNWLLLQACHNWQHFLQNRQNWPTNLNLATFLHFKTTLYNSVHLNFCPFIGSFYGYAKHSLCSSFEIDVLKLTSRRNISFTLTSDPLIWYWVCNLHVVTGSGSVWRSKSNTTLILKGVPSIIVTWTNVFYWFDLFRTIWDLFRRHNLKWSWPILAETRKGGNYIYRCVCMCVLHWIIIKSKVTIKTSRIKIK
jgi:hypothetical protein